ncbi:hypothetical protein GCM10010149_88310 [Nonomuraea roseoviolacea subsp. roseoviolacea]|uniref:hypothetical protein n=1 Tax=Nonomuraea roseoviolacea TaxID=103837 RepID=UPI0031E2B210
MTSIPEIIAGLVAFDKVDWQRNLAAVKARGEDPQKDAATSEAFARYTAGERILIEVLDRSGKFAGSVVRGDYDNSKAVNEAKRLIEATLPWQTYQESLNKS